MRFEIENFRRFHNPTYAEIAPLTVLVGENSSGKSSFLAGIRYIFQSQAPSLEASFNREPFFLGAYDQIAHYRGGRYGRSASFSLGLRIDQDELAQLRPDERFLRFSGGTPEKSYGEIRLTFGDEQSQPILTNVRFKNKYLAIDLDRKTLPRVRITRVDTNQHVDVVPSDRFTTISTTANRNSLSPFTQSIQSWAFSHEFGQKTKDKAESSDMEFFKLFTKATFPIYNFSDKLVYASAPFRTKPERTYSPVEASSSAEGSHIPILLAQAKAFERSKWNKIKDTIESFGAQSGMFRKIDIKRLGNSNSDPFQVIVTVSKDRSNIIDVGYGVSQILPLIVETLINDDAKIFAFQQPEVHLHPIAQAELGSYFVEFAHRSKKFLLLETHSDYIIDRIKSDLIRRKLSLDKYLSVLFFDKETIETSINRINFDEDGNAQDPPHSYRKFFLDESVRNLGL